MLNNMKFKFQNYTFPLQDSCKHTGYRQNNDRLVKVMKNSFNYPKVYNLYKNTEIPSHRAK